MNYHPKSKSFFSKYKIIVLAFCLFIFFSAFIFFFPIFNRSLWTTVSKPFWSTSQKVSLTFSATINFFKFKSNLISENTNLKDQINTLKLKVADYDLLVKENEDLKNLTSRKENVDRISARIISKPPQSPYDTLILDVGSNEGVSVHSDVYLSDSVLVGNVTAVTEHSSVVEMYSTGDKKNNAVLERTGASYELIGDGGGDFHIQTPKDADVLWGDVFVLSDLSSGILATVYYIDSSSQSSFKTIYLRVPGNVFQSKWVLIDTNNTN